MPPEDEEQLMSCSLEVDFTIWAWEQVTFISAREKLETWKNKQQKVMYAPTLSNLKVWLDNQDFNTMPADQQELFRLIVLFHQFYISEIMRQFNA